MGFRVVCFVIAVIAAGCASGDALSGTGTSVSPSTTDGDITTTTEVSLSATVPDVPLATRPLIDSQAILDGWDFQVCDGAAPASDISVERGQEIIDIAFARGISNAGSVGGNGRMSSLNLPVLTDEFIAPVAEIADATEVCISGQDPNDYVPSGPQELEGPGWRWIGAGSNAPVVSAEMTVTNQDQYDQLWAWLGEGPESGQIEVDFEREIIVTLNHSGGVNFDACGARFDGFGVLNGTVVVDMFHPGGQSSCLLIAFPATYAVALDRSLVGYEDTLTVARRWGPRAEPESPRIAAPIWFRDPTPIIEDETPPPPTTTTTIPAPPPTAPFVGAEVEAGILSTPQFPKRVGDLQSNGYDMPLPTEWEPSFADDVSTSIDVVGRGGLTVTFTDVTNDAWRAAISDSNAVLESGPETVTVPLYAMVDGQLVTTGQTVSGSQYRYKGRDSIVERVVRRFDLGNRVMILNLGYPDFATIDGMLEGPGIEDPLMRSLTNLTPEELLNDIRILAP